MARRRFEEARKRLEHETVDTYFDSGLPLDKASLKARIVPSDAPQRRRLLAWPLSYR